MQKLETVGNLVWVPMGEICEIAGKFCRLSISYNNGPGSCCYRTVWAYDTLEDAEAHNDKNRSSSNHSWDHWGRLKICDGAFGSSNYVKAVIEVCTAFDSESVRSQYYPYRWITRYSNGRIGIRITELREPNQTPEGAILEMICGL